MEKLIGRAGEIKVLQEALLSDETELIAIYGRRRVGKTFLVRNVYQKHMAFEFTGVHSRGMKDLLQNFSFALKAAKGSKVDLAVPGNWNDAMHVLQNFLDPVVQKKKIVIFFDEFPWIHTQKSNFLSAFEHFWNAWAAKKTNLKVVICGSSASWMIRNIVKSKGGLHNRVSRRIRLLPFNLHETEAYLKSRSVKLDHYHILQIYMAIGGIPQYLKAIKPGQSAAQAIDSLCFSKNGTMVDEFNNLYASLFDNAGAHISIIKALAKKTKGLTRNEIMDVCKLSSGGTATLLLKELTESGFIMPFIPFEKTSKDTIYKLYDEFSMFYLKFMVGKHAAGTWLTMSQSSSWKSWSGFAFESICLKHVSQIKEALGIGGILTTESVWRYA
ncbi:MAG TPA: ATP-binding protein, partial [Chitinophagaceae bacterium]|nr:ATP-binding protein [Chitinophagaceae bacterium]